MIKYSEKEKHDMLLKIQSFNLKDNFKIRLINEAASINQVELIQSSNQKPIIITGPFPILFYNTSRHVILKDLEQATAFFDFEKINIADFNISKLDINFENSALEIWSDLFKISIFCTEQSGWAIQHKDSGYIIEALEYGGIDLLQK